jgi:hypothetical protein
MEARTQSAPRQFVPGPSRRWHHRRGKLRAPIDLLKSGIASLDCEDHQQGAVHEVQTRSERSWPSITRDTHSHHDEEVLLIRLAMVTAELSPQWESLTRLDCGAIGFAQRAALRPPHRAH